MKFSSVSLFSSLLLATATTQAQPFFNRISTFLVCSQLDPTCNVADETSAEIVAASPDGNTLIYTDSAQESLGFVDITDPKTPVAMGTIALPGEPTAAKYVNGDTAVIAVNTSPDFVNVSGVLVVIDIATMAITATLDLPGQPDSVDVSPVSTQFIAVAIENERDEDLGDGAPPQFPPGLLSIIEMVDVADPSTWTTTNVNLTGLDGLLYPEDPEPEFVSINDDDLCIVTLQENNGLVLVDLTTTTVVASFSAGAVTLDQIDITEENIITSNGGLVDVLREPDGVTWVGNELFATADEGDLDGGSRGWTVFDSDGAVVYTSGNFMELETKTIGHYPESRSESKGNEPENIGYGVYGETPYLFVVSERSSVVFVYDATDPTAPVYTQVLPAGKGPEGIVTIPDRNLLIVASEVDSREEKVRGSIGIFEFGGDSASYPLIVSGNDEGGLPIPFSALSGLAAASPYGTDGDSTTLYTIEDSFYRASRMFRIDPTQTPAIIDAAFNIVDTNDILLTALTSNFGANLSSVFVDTMLNEDKTTNLDLEGIATSQSGGFWLASEGAGTVGEADRPVEKPNMLIKVDETGLIAAVNFLPADLDAVQLRFGFEGVAEDGQYVVVTMQRAWNNEENPRLAIYDTEEDKWYFAFYPLDAPESQNGGWVGLSDIAPLGGANFMVLERDDQAGPDAVIKRLYTINLDYEAIKSGDIAVAKDDLTPPETILTVSKTLYRDLVDEGDMDTVNGLIIEKVEGLAVTSTGAVYINTDNDGVDESSGEQLFLEVATFDGPAPTIAPAPTDAPVPVDTPTGAPEPTEPVPTSSPVDVPTAAPSAANVVQAGFGLAFVGLASLWMV